MTTDLADILKSRKSENVYIYFLVANLNFKQKIVTGRSSQFPGPLQTCESPRRDKRSSLSPDGSHQNRKKMNRSLFSVLTLMASLSSRNITLFVIIFFLIWVMIQRHLLPQVDLDVLIYDRFVLRAPFVAFSINARFPNVLKTKPECHIFAKD